MVLEVMIENNAGTTPTVAELGDWADTYGLDMPVLADKNSQVLASYAQGSIGLPYIVVLDRGVVVKKIGDGTESYATSLLGK